MSHSNHCLIARLEALLFCRERGVRETLRKSQGDAEAAASELERSQEVRFFAASTCVVHAGEAP